MSGQNKRRFSACLASFLASCLMFTANAAAPLRVPDTVAERAKACITCHGKEGIATNQGWFPRIAGQPAGYLYNQLVNFRDGRRDNPAMTYLVEHLSDAYLREFAEYFASLDLPYPPPQTVGAPKEVLMHGEALVMKGDRGRDIPACVQCHGSTLTGVAPSMPGLLGLPLDYVIGQFAFWKAGQRKASPPDCMAEIVARLSAEDIRALATWLSSQPVPNDSKPASSIALPLPMPCGSGLK